MKKFFVLMCSLFFISGSFAAIAENSPAPAPELTPQEIVHQEYIDFFAKVYDTMEKNYYYPVSKPAYEHFIETFDKKIYANLKSSGKSADYIRWRSAAYLVDALKSPEDIFSAFMPPKFAEKFEKDVLGKKIDLGIEGTLVPDGYRVDKVEIRADAYEKGLREKDVIEKIDGIQVVTLKPEEIADRLTPLENAKVVLVYRDSVKKDLHTIEAVSKEYFKQDVFMIPVDVPGVYCLQIKHFNQMTGPDLGRLMEEIMAKGDSSLIIDLRGNPGGPPLAAREIAAFFLTPEEEFTYFKWKNKPNATLDVPRIPEKYRYHGDIAILVNKGSGSASELFSGIMQWRKRATLIGTNTAGQVFLKSMFNFDDKSMVLLVTARGHRPDGEVFSFQGLTPNVSSPENTDDLIHYAANYLVETKKNRAQ